jgi:hypothetical protein
MGRFMNLVVASVPLLGCKPELPSLDYHGERVRVGSDVVDQVCGGTLTRMDREVEQIEARLDLPIQSSPLDVYIVDRDTVEAYCSERAANCTLTPRRGRPIVVMDQIAFEWAIGHELVHVRLADIASVPLFDEGIAVAVSPPTCPRPAPDIELSELLAAKVSNDFSGVRGSYYIAGELVAWLLGEFGPGEILDLMLSVERGSSPSTVQARYAEHFDRELADDYLVHVRTKADLDDLPPEDFGCLAPLVDASLGPIRLVGDLDCDSDRVHNNFRIEGGGYVEWTLALDHAQTLRRVGVVPDGTSLTIVECGCVPSTDDDVYLLPQPFEASQSLSPGTYRLRWTGELNAGLSLDVELVPED